MYLTRNQAGVYSASGVRIPPSPPDCDKPPHGGFFVTGFHERPRRRPPTGIRGKVFSHVFACRPLAPALYPTPGNGLSPPRQPHAAIPIFPSRRPAASCSAPPPRCPGQEGSRPSSPAEPPMIEFGHLTHVG